MRHEDEGNGKAGCNKTTSNRRCYLLLTISHDLAQPGARPCTYRPVFSLCLKWQSKGNNFNACSKRLLSQECNVYPDSLLVDVYPDSLLVDAARVTQHPLHYPRHENAFYIARWESLPQIDEEWTTRVSLLMGSTHDNSPVVLRRLVPHRC